MPTMVNPRSLALANANPRLLTAPNADILLSASTPIFHVNNSGVNTPGIITFNAILVAMEGTATFSCTGATLTNIVGNTCALSYESMVGDSATIKATIIYRNKEYSETVEITKVYDGANGVTGLNNALMYAYQRFATQPTGTPGVVEWSFPAAGITTATLANGWQKTIPSGTLPVWITAASASASGTLDTVQANEWTTPVILAQNGLDGISPALMNLTCTSQAFTYNSTGVATPANQTVAFTSELINTTGTATFTCTKYDSTGASLGTVVLGGTGNTRTLTDTQFTTGAFRAVVTATLGTLTDTITIVRLADGANGTGVSALAGYLTNESVTVPCASDGSAPVLTNAKGNFKVFQGTTDVTASCTFSVVGTTVVNTVAPTSGTGAYTITGAGTWASTSLTTSVTYRATHTPSGATIDQVFILTKAPAGLQGNAGVNSATVTIYQRTTTTTAPTLPSVVTTYTFSPSGLTGLNNGWTTTIPAASLGGYLWASTATAVATTATDTIAASEWAAAQLTVQPGAKGDRGNVQVARAIPGSAWSDSEAVLAISGTGYGVPQNRDIVTLYNNSASYSQQKYYDGTAWQALAAYFPGGVIVDGTVDAVALKAKTVTGDKIAADAITAESIKVTGSAGSLNRDPYFTSPTSWTLGSFSAATGPGGAAPANTYVQGTADYASVTSEKFPIDSTKSYTTSISAWASSGNNRALRVIVAFYDGAGAVIVSGVSSEWSDSLGSHFTQVFTPGGDSVWRSYKGGGFGAKVAGRPIPPNAKTCIITAQINAGGTGTSNSMAVTGVRVDEMVSSVTIEDGAITAVKVLAGSIGTNQLSISQGGAINSGQGAYNSGNGFWIEGAGTGHGARMSMGNSAGKRFLCDPQNDVLGLYGVVIDGPTITSPFYVTVSDYISPNNVNGSTVDVTLGASITSGSGNYRYEWGYSGAAGLSLVSGLSGPTLVVRATGTNRWCDGSFTVTVYDLSKGVASGDGAIIHIGFGNIQEV